jgi:hypothetical protein
MIPETLARRYRFDHYVPQHLPHEDALYRVCKEAASNVIRHAGARNVTVEAHVDQSAVRLFVRDDGGGLQPEVQAGIGLNSMREHLARLGGDLVLRPSQPHGLEVLATLPRRDRPHWSVRISEIRDTAHLLAGSHLMKQHRAATVFPRQVRRELAARAEIAPALTSLPESGQRHRV